MLSENRAKEFLRKAEEAELEEKMAADPKAKWAWEKIAVGYLELAELEVADRVNA